MKTVISSRHSPHFFCLSANSVFVSLDYSLLSGGIESFFLLSTCLLCTQQRNFNIVLFERLDQFRNLEREKERERERELESFIDLARILGGREDCLATLCNSGCVRWTTGGGVCAAPLGWRTGCNIPYPPPLSAFEESHRVSRPNRPVV